MPKKIKGVYKGIEYKKTDTTTGYRRPYREVYAVNGKLTMCTSVNQVKDYINWKFYGIKSDFNNGRGIISTPEDRERAWVDPSDKDYYTCW